MMNDPFSNALEDKTVTVKVVDIDYHRSFAAFGSVDTHYIIQVKPSPSSKKQSRFEAFRIEKTFTDLRTLVTEFKRASNETTDHLRIKGQSGWKDVPESTQSFIAFSDAFAHVVDSSPKTYLAKMSFDHVVKLSQERKDIFEKAIAVILENYPDKDAQKTQPVELFESIVNAFFLTDVSDDNSNEDIIFEDFDYEHIVPPDDNVMLQNNTSERVVVHERVTTDFTTDTNYSNNSNQSHQPKQILQKDNNIPLQAMSRRKRLPSKNRIENETIFMSSESVHMYDGEDSQKIDDENHILNDPKKVIGIFFVAMHLFLMIPDKQISIKFDTLALLFFSFFVAGFRFNMSDDKEQFVHTERRPIRQSGTNSAYISKRVFFGDKSDLTSFMETNTPINGVLKRFPDGAELGTVPNCWSPSSYHEFHVRGVNYLTDRKKVPSGDYIFKPRGVELFLSDCCPAHIGRYKVMLNQTLREKPSFVINFRLPWGNVVFTSEIPRKFLPFLRFRYCPSLETTTPPSMDGMSPQEICTCRFLMGDDDHKRKTLKIIPSVVKGPWIVRKVAEQKPAIIGSKMPTHYIYEPANTEKGLCEYLEMDLDIVASSAARGVLAVAQRYTKALSLDLGFVIQGNSTDELPEQMLVAMRLHSLDPLTQPNLPDDVDSCF